MHEIILERLRLEGYDEFTFWGTFAPSSLAP